MWVKQVDMYVEVTATRVFSCFMVFEISIYYAYYMYMNLHLHVYTFYYWELGGQFGVKTMGLILAFLVG